MLYRSVRELLFNIIKHSGVDSAIVEATMHISKVLPHTRIIGLSMHDDDETRDRIMNAGASAYM